MLQSRLKILLSEHDIKRGNQRLRQPEGEDQLGASHEEL